MKNIFTIYLIFGFGLLSLKATMITVDNNYPSIGDYTTLQAAHDAASNGDTIIVAPSNAYYTGIIVIKNLHLIGAGFEPIDEVKTAILTGSMTFSAGSDGSTIEGFDKNGDVHYIVDADNITIKRNKLGRLTIMPNHTSTVIISNFIIGEVDWYEGYLITVNNNNEVYLSGNKIVNFSSSNARRAINAANTNITCTIINNVVMVATWGIHPYNDAIYLSDGGANNIVKNNIIVSGNCYGSGYSYNMGSSVTVLPAGEGNIGNIDMNTVFENVSLYNFHLKADSPAIDAGQYGVDMGAYGGTIPFIDGGYPEIPAIYYLNVPTTGNQQDGVNVTIKARTNN